MGNKTKASLNGPSFPPTLFFPHRAARRVEPQNPFEMNVNRNRSHDHDEINREVRSHEMMRVRQGATPGATSRSFNSSVENRSSTTLGSSNTSSFIAGYSPLNPRPRHMSSTVDSSTFFNRSNFSASSALDSTGGSSSCSRTGQLRRMMQQSSIRSGPHH